MANDLTEIKQGEVQAPVRTKTELDDDLDFGRSNLKDMAETGVQAVAELAQVCSQSGDRVDYEKLGLLMKNTADVIKDMMQVSQTKEVLNKPPEPPPESSVTNQINFVGSTTEMAAFLQELKEKNE